jgi:hypothetical protein
MAIRVYRSLRLRLAFPGFRLRLQKKRQKNKKKHLLKHFIPLTRSLHLFPGANPTIASYNASVADFYNATDSLERFEIK